MHDLAQSEPPRDDLYLILAGASDLGIKWRARSGTAIPHLEFKGATSLMGVRSFPSIGSGRVQCWSKWSYPAECFPSGLRRIFEAGNPGATLTIRKWRRVRVFEILDDGEPRPASPIRRLERCITLERTRLEVRGTPFWTLGLEASPDDDRTRGAFSDTVARLLEGYPGSPLAEANSTSYPGWIRRFL